RPRYGTIYHDKVVSKKASGKKATLEVSALWKDHHGKLLLIESTTYHFIVDGDNFVIDRSSTLQAAPDTEVAFKDVKDGFLAIRVARELELPSEESAKYVDNSGNITEVKALSNEGVSGDYLSSEGIRGNDVWSTRAKWVTLMGRKDNRDVSSKGKEKPNLSLKPKESVTFRYRIVIHEGKPLSQDQIAAMAKY